MNINLILILSIQKFSEFILKMKSKFKQKGIFMDYEMIISGTNGLRKVDEVHNRGVRVF